jgi:hypothetical protein
MSLRASVFVVCLAVLPCGSAWAGRNAGGALIVHTNDDLAYTVDRCDRFDDYYSPGSCEAAGTRTDLPEDTRVLIWLIAAFPQGSDPGVSRIDFGLIHNLQDLSWISYRSGRTMQQEDVGCPGARGTRLLW